MSVIKELTIRGIRSFGVNAADEQKITFASPLTVIAGGNGCGKTTILECLKYALTGELPPNCNDGQSFISNPDVLKIGESLGQVELKLRNEARDIDCTISRSAKRFSTRDQKNQFRTFDSTITVWLDSPTKNSEVETYKRSNDATEYVCSLMGVSKAIISNVLFCHHEEANWPLGTDQEVMSRFNEIFGTTEYNNLVERIRQFRKKFDAAAKDKLVELEELEMVKEMAEKMNLEISVQQNEKSEMEERLKSIGAELTPLHAEIEGRFEEKKKLIETKEKQLAESKYKDSALNNAKAMFKAYVYEQTVEELSAYAEELERALIEFHKKKMKKINPLIRELWRSIYKGDEIAYIEIRAEEVNTYRVVAFRNGTFVDFRSYSSAVQRDLACLIIRIALAETFSCGVLVLDKLTTNLDRKNSQSLSEVLNKLVEERKGQDNFMLIVITHDEEFIDALGNVTSYYKLKRDDHGKSQIEKLRVRN